MEPRPERRSIRYVDYDYSMAGYYALTICATDRAPLFGHLPPWDDEAVPMLPLVPTVLGNLVGTELLALPGHYPTIRLDEWILMPNHLHLILVIIHNRTVSVAQVLGAFKSRCYRAWRLAILAQGLANPPSCWQRNYYERIIRDGIELEAYREYIRQNPTRWHGR